MNDQNEAPNDYRWPIRYDSRTAAKGVASEMAESHGERHCVMRMEDGRFGIALESEVDIVPYAIIDLVVRPSYEEVSE